MDTPEQRSFNERLNKIEDDLLGIKRQVQTLFVFMILILFVLVQPVLTIPVIIAYIAWQLIDVLHRRSKRKRREQQLFQELSGRVPSQKQTMNEAPSAVGAL